MTSEKHTTDLPYLENGPGESADAWRVRLADIPVRRQQRDITLTRARWANIPIAGRDMLRRIVFERDGWACVRCGATDTLTIDHVIPQSKGGHSRPDNLQTLCRPCNCAKRDRA